MKKILALVLITFLYSCSSDDAIQTDIQQNVFTTQTEQEGVTMASVAQLSSNECFGNLTASVSVDLSGGFANPVVEFKSKVTAAVSSKNRYRVRVEVQTLADCDDLNVPSSTSTYYGPSTYFNYISTNNPQVNVPAGNLPGTCYRWRMVFDHMTGSFIPACTTVSPWYESPLF